MTYDISPLCTDSLRQLQQMFVSAGFNIRFVGGSVRDLLAGHVPHDVDLCTDANPAQQIVIYDKNKVKWIGTGLKHGTVQVMLDDIGYEITSLRVDVETDGRHAVVEFTNNWDADLSRRDFTFNSMSLDFDGNLYDPFNGLQDLQDGRVKFVGDINTRIQEDYLRIFRFVRFVCRFGKDVDTFTANSIMNHVHKTDTISGERIWDEINKIVKAGKNVETGFKLLNRLGLDRRIGIDGSKAKFRNGMKPIAVIFTAIQNKELFFKRIPVTNGDVKLFTFLENNNNPMTLADMKNQCVRGVTKDFINQKCLIDDNLEFSKLVEWDIPVFPLTGEMLLKMGFEPGPNIGKILDTWKTRWIASDFKMTVDDMVAGVKAG